MPSFNEFDFQTALSPGINFAACDFKKSSDHASFCDFGFQTALSPHGGDILGSRSFAPSRFWELPLQANGSHTTADKRGISSDSRQNDRVLHVCAVSFLCDHIFCWRIFGGNALYSRKLDSYISVVLSDVNLSDVGYVCLSLWVCLVYLPFVSPLLNYKGEMIGERWVSGCVVVWTMIGGFI